MPKCLFFQDLEGLTEVLGQMSAGMSGPKLPLWADFSFLKGLQGRSTFPLQWRFARQRHLPIMLCNRGWERPDEDSDEEQRANVADLLTLRIF